MNEPTVRGRWWKIGLLLLGLLIVGKGKSSAADISVTCQKVDAKIYKIEGDFLVEASSRIAWKVLTDYDRLDQFVPGMHSSTIKERRSDGVLLEQEAEGKFFLFSRTVHVLLDVHERLFEKITFRDVSLQDFRFYRGSWSIEENPSNLRITYELEVEPMFDAPKSITKAALKRNARNLLNKVRLEIIRQNGEEASHGNANP